MSLRTVSSIVLNMTMLSRRYSCFGFFWAKPRRPMPWRSESSALMCRRQLVSSTSRTIDFWKRSLSSSSLSRLAHIASKMSLVARSVISAAPSSASSSSHLASGSSRPKDLARLAEAAATSHSSSGASGLMWAPISCSTELATSSSITALTSCWSRMWRRWS